MPREELDLRPRDVGLHPKSVVLVLQGGLPHPREDLLERLQALREHRADRAEQFQADLVEALESLRGDDPGHLSKVRGDIVGPFHAVSIRLRREGEGQGVDDRHVRDAEPHLAHDHPYDVLRLPRRRGAQEVGEESDLAFLAPLSRFAGDRVEVLIDLGDRERCRLQRLLTSARDGVLRHQPEVSLVLPHSIDVRFVEPRCVHEHAEDHLLRETELDAHVIGMDAALG